MLRQVGFWRNSVRFLQLAWEQVRHVREASFWVECAECRTSWRDVWSRWLSAKGWLHVGMVGDPLRENLMGRQLLQLGQRFHLLPMRHVPVEEPYEEVLRIVPQAGEEDCLAQFQIATDGSARSSVGAFSAVLLAPYAAIETAVVGRGRMTGAATNITAEMQAAIQGLRMAVEVSRVSGIGSFVLLTDSMYVVQLLEDSIVTTMWNRLLLTSDICAKWVRGHANCLLNNLADLHAKHMLEAQQPGVEYVRALTHERF